MSDNDRLYKLEKQVRGLKRLLYSMIAIVVLVVTSGFYEDVVTADIIKARVIEAKDFQIIGEDGKEFVRIGISEDARDGNITTYNKEGQKLIHLGTKKKGRGVIKIYNKNGTQIFDSERVALRSLIP